LWQTAVFTAELRRQFENRCDELGPESRQQGERVFAVDLLQLLGAEKAALLQTFHVLGERACGVIGAEENLR
jgi:hypothetical protein